MLTAGQDDEIVVSRFIALFENLLISTEHRVMYTNWYVFQRRNFSVQYRTGACILIFESTI